MLNIAGAVANQGVRSVILADCPTCQILRRGVFHVASAKSTTGSRKNSTVCSYTLPGKSSGLRNLTLSSDVGSPVLSASGLSGRYDFLFDYSSAQSALSGNCTQSNTTCIAAVSCDFWSCVRAYSLDVEGGNITEKAVPITTTNLQNSFGTAGDNKLGAVDLACAGPKMTQQLRDIGYIITPEVTEWVYYKGDGRSGDGNITTKLNATIPDHCVYAMDATSSHSISLSLGRYFTGNVTSSSYAWGLMGPPQLLKLQGNGRPSLPSEHQ
ncbi:hypothetical protein EJ08DRAFT_663189 [Tothia fuscella]|uniref:Uncharacterized protein n=1 Tax=Tothia fuscella TaxID=1048955 RepID=A0A9P4NLP9_9PEZI|nr:hypothetical protein EJ08DRAFT_663189 [Tothia fuscella]